MQNDSAFPMVVSDSTSEAHYGLTKRQWFAGMALMGACASHNDGTIWEAGEMAEYCVKRADALIAELEK